METWTLQLWKRFRILRKLEFVNISFPLGIIIQHFFSCIFQCCAYCLPCCLIYRNAEDMNKSGILYCLLSCIMPCIPILLLRGEARDKYNIEVCTLYLFREINKAQIFSIFREAFVVMLLLPPVADAVPWPKLQAKSKNKEITTKKYEKYYSTLVIHYMENYSHLLSC